VAASSGTFAHTERASRTGWFAVVRRGEHRRVVAVFEQTLHGARIERRAVGQHDDRVRHVVAERGEPRAERRAGAPFPVRCVYGAIELVRA
jgi:hypothetical protein